MLQVLEAVGADVVGNGVGADVVGDGVGAETVGLEVVGDNVDGVGDAVVGGPALDRVKHWHWLLSDTWVMVAVCTSQPSASLSSNPEQVGRCEQSS